MKKAKKSKKNRTSSMYKLAPYGLAYCLLLGTPLMSAPSIRSETLRKVKEYISQIRHPERVNIMPGVQALAPTDTHLYLIEIADDTRLLSGVRMRALGLLINFPENTDVRDYLESKAEDEMENPAHRNMALATYVRTYYEKQPVRVETFVRRCQNSSSKLVSKGADKIVLRIELGSKKPAGEKHR